jgi:hypothetical protein
VVVMALVSSGEVAARLTEVHVHDAVVVRGARALPPLVWFWAIHPATRNRNRDTLSVAAPTVRCSAN